MTINPAAALAIADTNCPPVTNACSVSWDAMPGAAGYSIWVQHRTGSEMASRIDAGTNTTLPAEFTNVLPVNVWVSAYDSTGNNGDLAGPGYWNGKMAIDNTNAWKYWSPTSTNGETTPSLNPASWSPIPLPLIVTNPPGALFIRAVGTTDAMQIQLVYHTNQWAPAP